MQSKNFKKKDAVVARRGLEKPGAQAPLVCGKFLRRWIIKGTLVLFSMYEQGAFPSTFDGDWDFAQSEVLSE